MSCHTNNLKQYIRSSSPMRSWALKGSRTTLRHLHRRAGTGRTGSYCYGCREREQQLLPHGDHGYKYRHRERKGGLLQAILYRSSEDDPDLYYSVYDSLTQMVYYCLCSPSTQEFEDVSCNSMQGEADQVAEWLKAYIAVNAEALRRWNGSLRL
jgi:hypothetical protein